MRTFWQRCKRRSLPLHTKFMSKRAITIMRSNSKCSRRFRRALLQIWLEMQVWVISSTCYPLSLTRSLWLMDIIDHCQVCRMTHFFIMECHNSQLSKQQYNRRPPSSSFHRLNNITSNMSSTTKKLPLSSHRPCHRETKTYLNSKSLCWNKSWTNSELKHLTKGKP